MKNSERNRLVLENFVLHVTHCSDEREPSFKEEIVFTPEILYQCIDDYIEEDHVDGKENPYDGKTLDAIIQGVDWRLLKGQKDILIHMIEDWSQSDDPIQKENAKEVEGILNLLDSLQDYAVDTLGKSEKEVFNIDEA